jgi:hypothetical protein
VVLESALLASAPAFAESPSVTIQWGGLAFSDQASTVVHGSANRFTELDNPSLASLRHESSLNEILGLNLVSISWTKQWNCSICQAITTNVTAGAVLTPEDPSRHETDIQRMLAMSQSRSAGIENENSIDGMGAFVNKVFSIQRNGNGVAFGTSFVRAGGTLSKDLFEREGVRGLSLPFDVGLPQQFSLMGRVSASQQFLSLAYRYEGIKVETWNQSAYSNPARGDLGIAVAYTVVFDGKGWKKCGFIHCH